MYKLLYSAFLIVLAIMCGSSVRADNSGVDKFRSYLPEEINALPESIRKSQVPMMYLQAASTGMAPGAREFIAAQLNRLLYNGIGDYEGAIRSFQMDLGEKPTGKLTVWQIFQLYYRSSMQSVLPPLIPQTSMSEMKAEYAYVHGTMMILDDKIAWPINYVKIGCYKDEGYCRLQELEVELPKENDWSYIPVVMWPSENYYRITNWSKSAIQAEFMGIGAACRSTTLDLNYETNEFYLITKNATKECDVLGQKLDPLKKPRITQIVNGEKIIAAEHEAFKKKTYDMLSSEFRARIEKQLLSTKSDPLKP